MTMTLSTYNNLRGFLWKNKELEKEIAALDGQMILLVATEIKLEEAEEIINELIERQQKHSGSQALINTDMAILSRKAKQYKSRHGQ